MYSRPEEVVEYISAKLNTNKVSLGLGYIGKYDEKKIPKYPAVVVSAGPTAKEIHGSRTFQIELRTLLWVYHARATLTYVERSLADLQLATAIVNLIEADMTLGGNAIHSYIDAETPGVIQPRSEKSDLIVSTRLSQWTLTQKRFGM